MRHRQAILWGICAAAALTISGCSDGRPARVPVSGQVLIDGKPLGFGWVTFYPAQGRSSSGSLDSNGRFTLTCFDRGDGAVLGEHRVQVIAGESLSATKTKWHAPKKYVQFAKSGIRKTITEPTNSMVIELTWNGRQPFVEVDRGGALEGREKLGRK